MANSLNSKVRPSSSDALGATDFSPGDFPLGSPQSRAAARLLLMARALKLTLSFDDEDALELYSGCCYLNAQMDPDYKLLEGTAAYKRGEELRDAIYAPVVPAHLDPHLKRSTLASLEFEILFRREPTAGDILRRTDLERRYAMRMSGIERFIAAWQRQIPGVLCPLKIEDGQVYCHYKPGSARISRWSEGDDRGGWHTDDETPQLWWENLASEVSVHRSDMGRISAVLFLGVIDGKHRCRPATEVEINQCSG